MDGKTCLVTKEALNNAQLNNTQENYVLYFARKSVYGHHGDTPVMGVGADYVKHSQVEGPYAAPVSKSNYFDGGNEIRIEPILLVLPEVPVFVSVKLWILGLCEEVSDFRIPSHVTRLSEVAELAFEAFKRKAANVKQSEDGEFKGKYWKKRLTGEYCGRIVSLEYRHNELYSDEQYSNLELTMFGVPLSVEPSSVWEELSVRSEARYIWNSGIVRKTFALEQKGLAYNLDLSAIEDVSQVSKLENIIL